MRAEEDIWDNEDGSSRYAGGQDGHIGWKIFNGVPLYGTATAAWVRLHLLPRNSKKHNRPCPRVPDAGSEAAAAAVSHLAEQTLNRDCGDGIIILPHGTRIKGKLAQILKN